jgi:3-oxoacyl-[acyl-carrier protein] reductase
MSGGPADPVRTAIVTGAGSGIGAAVAREFSRAGMRVMLGFAPGDPRGVEASVAEILAAGGQARAHPADVGVAAEVEGLVEACCEEFGPPDVVLANAGLATRTPTEKADPAAFERLLAVNLLGAHHLFRAALAPMRERGWGRLLATSSTSGHLYGWPDHAAYCVAKAGLVGLVRTYAAEYGGFGITANAVAPGLIRTPQSLDPVNSLGEERLAEAAAAVPVGRAGTPEDIAAAFGFLAGDGAAYVNGHVMVVDGGLSVVEPA